MANSNPGHEGPRGIKFEPPQQQHQHPDQRQFKMRGPVDPQPQNPQVHFHDHQQNQPRYQQVPGGAGDQPHYQQIPGGAGDQPQFQWVRGADGQMYKVPLNVVTAAASTGFFYKALPWIYTLIIVVLLSLLIRICLMRGWDWFKNWVSEDKKERRSPSPERNRNNPRGGRREDKY